MDKEKMNGYSDHIGTLDDTPYSYDLPLHWQVDIVESKSIHPLTEPRANVTAVLADPLDAPPVYELVGPGDQVCLAVAPPDVSRHDQLLISALLREFEKAGIRDEDLLLLVANGRQGRLDYERKLNWLGREVLERYRVLDHNVGEVVHLGQWQGIPLTINRHLLEADLLATTGVVAPHLYAGYSGGGETVALGCAGEATIEALYGVNLLYHPQVRPGQIRGNPFQALIRTIAERARLRFVLDTVLDPQGRPVDVQAGAPLPVHQYLTFAASSLYDSPVSQTYDVAAAGVDARYDTNLYEAIRGALLIGLAPRPVVRPGGVILLPARTPQAVGKSLNAQNFFDALQSVRSLDRLVQKLGERSCRPGEARALQLARLAERNRVIVVGSEFPEMIEACHLEAAADMEQAVDQVRWLLGDEIEALIVPHARHTLPVPPPAEWDDPVGISTANVWS